MKKIGRKINLLTNFDCASKSIELLRHSSDVFWCHQGTDENTFSFYFCSSLRITSKRHCHNYFSSSFNLIFVWWTFCPVFFFSFIKMVTELCNFCSFSILIKINLTLNIPLLNSIVCFNLNVKLSNDFETCFFFSFVSPVFFSLVFFLRFFPPIFSLHFFQNQK